jgi:hypothetical protein
MSEATPSSPAGLLPAHTRRSFITSSLAVAAGVGVGATLVSAAPAGAARQARFDLHTGCFPEVPVSVEVALPGVREGVRGRAWLHIRTPREHLIEELGEVAFKRGRATIETRLVYPYDGRVAGQYSYHVEVACGSERVVTATPATYAMRQFHWFS